MYFCITGCPGSPGEPLLPRGPTAPCHINQIIINHTHFENTGDLGNLIGSSQCDVLANPFSFGSKSLIQEIQPKKNICIKCSNSNRLFFLLKKGLVARRKKKKRNIQIFNHLVSLDLVCLISSFPKT